MQYYVLAVGGTGNKVLESMIYAAAADVYYQLVDGIKVPLKKIHMLSVDVDASCGNTTRAKIAFDNYTHVCKQLKNWCEPHRNFNTELVLNMWDMTAEVNQQSIDAQVRNHREDQPLAWTLYQPTESSLQYSEGFRGHPDLGVLFFSDLIQKLEEADQSRLHDQFMNMIHEITGHLDNNEEVCVSLVGSIFGGTGASGIPIISRFLRERFEPYNQEDRKLFRMSATLMLPYFNVPQTGIDESAEIVINSSIFLDKAKTALNYYGFENMVSGETEKGVYDVLYLLGLDKKNFVTTGNYSYGSESQKNDSHLMEWLAARSISHFYRNAGRNMKNGCYILQCHSKGYSWDLFDDEEKYYRIEYGGLAKTATVFLGECYPYIHALLSETGRESENTVNYYTSFFKGMSQHTEEEVREKLNRNLDEIKDFFIGYVGWICQVLHSLPPSMREAYRYEDDIKAMRTLVEQRIDAQYGLARTLEDEKSTEEERHAKQESLDKILQSIGELQARLTASEIKSIVYQVKNEKGHQLRSKQIECAQEKEKLDEMKEDDTGRYSKEKVDAEAVHYDSMVQVRDMLQTKLAMLEEYFRAVLKIEKTDTVDRKMIIAENALFDAGLMMKLETIADGLEMADNKTEHAEDKLGRDLIESNTDELMLHIQDLVYHKVHDTVTIQKIMMKLGMGYRGKQKSELTNAPARFLITLLHAVFDEVNV